MNFTKRETTVMQLVAQGLRTRDIAEQLGVSQSTVRNHLDNMYMKLGIHTRVELVMYAVRNGLLEEVKA